MPSESSGRKMASACVSLWTFAGCRRRADGRDSPIFLASRWARSSSKLSPVPSIPASRPAASTARLSQPRGNTAVGNSRCGQKRKAGDFQVERRRLAPRQDCRLFLGLAAQLSRCRARQLKGRSGSLAWKRLGREGCRRSAAQSFVPLDPGLTPWANGNSAAARLVVTRPTRVFSQRNSISARDTVSEVPHYPNTGPEAALGARRLTLALAQRLDNHVQHGNEEQVENGGDDHSAEDRGSHRMAALRSGAAGEDQRQHAQNEGERGHQDGTQADASGLDRRFANREPFVAQLLGELDNQNPVLRGQADQHHQPDLAINVV